MALTLSGTNGIVGAGFTVDPSGASVTSGIGTFSKIAVGANNVNPTQALEVKGSSSVAIQVESSAAQYSEVQINNSTRNYTLGVRPDISHGFAIRDASAGTNRFTIDTSGNATVNSGNLVIGTAGAGIDFSVTSDGSGTDSSELLDDYEEGSWNPTITGGAITTNGAYYTKVGRVVHWYLYGTITNTANNSTEFRIYGLPFTVGGNTQGLNNYYGGAASINYTQSANNGGLTNMGVLAHGSTNYLYFHFIGVGDSNQPTNSYFHSHMLNQGFIIAGSYFV